MSTEPTLDVSILSQWIGRSQSVTDTLHPQPAVRMQATLNKDDPAFQPGDPLPHCWHWLYFLEAPRMDRLGRDGHAALGDFLPPVALPKRMWAGARLAFHAPLRLGETLERVSTVESVSRKSGRSGELCFVTVLHEIRGEDGLRLSEHHDIVYREAGGGGSPETPVAPTDSDRSRLVQPSSTLLFRYSALTFNGHRIHYDLDFCRNVEGYPGLVFHGPLTATLLMDLALEQAAGQRPITSFEFRAMSPLFHDRSFGIAIGDAGDHMEAWAATPEGRYAMKARIGLDQPD